MRRREQAGSGKLLPVRRGLDKGKGDSVASTPLVSFVVPCYKLGHLLGECVRSILAQSYTNLELLIMDDQSPDNTGDVAASFPDPRVRYIRNAKNLGHLRNYNEGISQCRGKYIWLISADDYLREPCVLRRYVDVMEANPKIGYVFCSGIGVSKGVETGVLPYSLFDRADRIINGRRFLEDLLQYNFILAASALVRRECYEKCGLFPLDPRMEWSGDWYLWCAFALHFDVAYFAEPMVCYRAHELSMTRTLAQPEQIHKCSGGDIAVPVMIRDQAIANGQVKIAQRCLLAIAAEYTRQCTSKQYQANTWSLGAEEFEESLSANVAGEAERRWVRARVSDGLGDRLWMNGDTGSARRSYLKSLRMDPWRLPVYAKTLLVLIGVERDKLHKLVQVLRRHQSEVMPEHT
jgi:glycosyl transferase family 2